MSASIVEQWTECLDGVNRRHTNHPVTIEVLGMDVGDQIAARHVSLMGVSLDVHDRPCGAVSILLQSAGGTHTERLIHQPVNVQLKTDARGNDEVLAIEAADGTTTLVTFE